MSSFIIVLIIIISFLIGYNMAHTKSDKKRYINTLIRQSARWATAAEQDNNSMIAVLHANYGAGYLWALKDIFSEKEIMEYANVDVLKFKEEIVKVQDTATKNMIKLCPGYAPKKTYLTKLGGEGV